MRYTHSTLSPSSFPMYYFDISKKREIGSSSVRGKGRNEGVIVCQFRPPICSNGGKRVGTVDGVMKEIERDQENG